MSSIFPLRETVTPDEEREPRLVDLKEETANEVFDALSSQTTREIFLALHQTPQTTSDLAEATETSVQNVQYHLKKLTEADLVEVVDTWYSARGTEMKVYAPTDDSLVLFAGRDKQGTLQRLLSRFAGVFTLLLPVSLLAGLGTRFATDTDQQETVTIEGTEPTGEDAPPADDTSTDDTQIQQESTDGVDLGSLSGEETVIVDNETAFIFGEETATAVENATLTPAEDYAGDVGSASAESAYVIEGEVAEPGTEVTLSDDLTAADNGTSLTVESEMTAFENATLSETANGDELVAADRLNESALLLDGDINTTVTLPSELLSGVGETTTIAGLDPALAVAAGVLVGGLTIAGALTAWYGTTDLTAGSTEDTSQ